MKSILVNKLLIIFILLNVKLLAQVDSVFIKYYALKLYKNEVSGNNGLLKKINATKINFSIEKNNNIKDCIGVQIMDGKKYGKDKSYKIFYKNELDCMSLSENSWRFLIAHEIGHILYNLLENDKEEKELWIDNKACQILMEEGNKMAVTDFIEEYYYQFENESKKELCDSNCECFDKRFRKLEECTEIKSKVTQKINDLKFHIPKRCHSEFH